MPNENKLWERPTKNVIFISQSEAERRKVYYRDTDGRFDELKVNAGAFVGFAPCSEGQQTAFSKMLGQ